MATVFMKWLETKPGDYDRGIRLLTLGRLQPLKERIAADYVGQRPGAHVLEIGCGTGTLALMMAARGAHVTAVDASPLMLAEAVRQAEEAGLADSIVFKHLDVTELTNHLESGSFDIIVSTLAFSEFLAEVRRYALQEAASLLKPGGWLLIGDEVVPDGIWARLVYWLVRLPLVIITWLLTRATTTPLDHFSQTLAEAGFIPSVLESHLGGSLQLIGARRAADADIAASLPRVCPRLSGRVTPQTLLLDVWSFFNRIIPPYTKQATGLYRIGNPDRSSPVLVTGNYELTVRRLVAALDGAVDCWLVVANSRGINVWCAAGGGHFTAEDVIAAIKTSGVTEVVDHHALILPQLCANGVDGWKIRQETHWGVHWGPVRASDISAYLNAGRKKTEAMRHVTFPLKARLEMTTVTLIFYAVPLIIPFLIFWQPYALPLLGLSAAIAYFYGVFLPWIPGRDGLGKGVTLAALTLTGLVIWSLGWGHLSPGALLNWSLGLGFLAFFVGAEFQGMSPLMRGEQGNWTIEGLVGLVVLIVYGASRLLIGG
jgi:ubiquinone/menaquinone biosynthesis C-methylase UbiE